MKAVWAVSRHRSSANACLAHVFEGCSLLAQIGAISAGRRYPFPGFFRPWQMISLKEPYD